MNSHKGRSRKRRTPYGKKVLLAAAAAMLFATAAVGTSLAFLVDKSITITNTFEPSEVKGDITEEFKKGDEIKKNVAIQNTGDVAAYVRVALIPNWVDSKGNIAAEAIKSDYELTLNLEDSPWFEESEGDHYYYYYSTPVPAGESTKVLVELCKPLVSKTDSAGNELHFELHVIASLIQAEPDAAVEKAWKVKVTGDEGNKTISKSTRSNE